MANVEDVAEIIINYMNAEEEPHITNLMLNKLLYFAQGHCLAETGKPLFDDDFEAWDFGSVIPKIYHKYKICGKNSIASDNEINKDEILDWEQLPIVEDVLKQYSEFSPTKLVNLTHEENSPWDIAKKKESRDNRHILIDKDAIKSYFQTVPLADDFEDLSDEVKQDLFEFEQAKANGTLVTYSLDEVRKHCGLAS